MDLTLPRPHPNQRRVLTETRRFNVVACGRRFGKTSIGINRMAATALAGQPVGWFAPTYKMLQEVWRESSNLLHSVASRSLVGEHRIELVTGGVVDMWSLDSPNTVRGRRYRRVILDEAAIVPDLEQAWNEAIRPTLTDMQGDAFFLSTPKGHNYFWRLFCRGEDPEYADHISWSMPTTANPLIAAGEVEAARREMPDRSYRQEYLAEFIEDGGGVFRGVSEVVDGGRSDSDPPMPGADYMMGVDLARIEDFTVLCVLAANGRQVYHERFNQISWERQIQSVIRVAGQYRARVLVDSTGVGDPIFEALRRAGLNVSGYQFTSQSKEALIDALAMGIEQGGLRLMDVPAQTAELQAFQYELTPARHVRMGAPSGMHDDCVIALALANWGRSLGFAMPYFGIGKGRPG